MNETYGLLSLTKDELEFLRWLVIDEIKHLDEHAEDSNGERFFIDTIVSVAYRINSEIRDVERREKEKAAIADGMARSAEAATLAEKALSGMTTAFATEPKKESQFQL